MSPEQNERGQWHETADEKEHRQAREKAFLQEYELLCRKHDIIIDACGCCGSPFLTDLRDDTLPALDQHIAHLGEE